MSKLIDNYRAVNEGKLSKAEFLRQTVQQYPGYINQFTSFDDAVQIFRNKGILSEEIMYQCPGDKFPLEQIEKGIDFELEAMGLNPMFNPTPGDYKKAKTKAIESLMKDPLFYIKKEACCCDNCKQTQAEAEAKKGVDYKQKKAEGQMQVVKPNKVNLQESGIHKDVNLDAEVGSGTETLEGPKKKRDPRDRSLDHKWSVDDYKVAYVIAEFKKRGVEAVAKRCGMSGLNSTNISAATYLINCTSDALQLVLQGIRKFELNDYDEKNEKEFLASYKLNKNFLEAYNELHGKSLEDCVSLINPTKVGNVNADIAGLETRVIKDREKDREKNRLETIEKNKLKDKLEGLQVKYDKFRAKYRKLPAGKWLEMAKSEVGWTASDEAKAKKYGLNTTLKESTYTDKRESFNESDKILVQLATAIMQKINPETGEKYTPAEARTKARKMIKAKQQKAKADNTDKAMNEQKILQENIQKVIARVLTEAATTNLAQLSDQNATIQGVPAILNSLENIVTEIESFILKEQQKIQSAFDQIGNIKNEDNIPIGYKFVEPILNSLKQDLEPVLAKVNLDDLKLPEAPEPDQTEMQPTGDVENLAGPGIDDVANGDVKAGLYKPNGAKPKPLAESKNRRYTR